MADARASDVIDVWDRATFAAATISCRNISQMFRVEDASVEPLMKHWGGEVASMWLRDDTLLAPLSKIGRARVIELAVPVTLADCSFSAARSVIATLARSRGAIPDKFAFGLCVTSALAPATVLAVYREGEQAFEGMGRCPRTALSMSISDDGRN